MAMADRPNCDTPVFIGLPE